MTIGSLWTHGLRGGLTLTLTLAASAQSIQPAEISPHGAGTALERVAWPTCLVEVGSASGLWMPSTNGTAGLLAGDLIDARGQVAYRLDATLAPNLFSVASIGDADAIQNEVWSFSGSCYGEIRTPGGEEVVAYLLGDWSQALGSVGTFQATLVDATQPYQDPPVILGAIQGSFALANVLPPPQIGPPSGPVQLPVPTPATAGSGSGSGSEDSLGDSSGASGGIIGPLPQGLFEATWMMCHS